MLPFCLLQLKGVLTSELVGVLIGRRREWGVRGVEKGGADWGTRRGGNWERGWAGGPEAGRRKGRERNWPFKALSELEAGSKLQ